MKRIHITLGICVAISIFAYKAQSAVPVNFNLSQNSLIENNQNQIFEPKPLASLSEFTKFAKVHFIVDDTQAMGFYYNPPHVSIDSNSLNKTCSDLGFKTTGSCPENSHPVGLCPYNSSYFRECCHNSYAYSKAECAYPQTISVESCGGKHKCYCDKTVYQYTTDNCPAPKELSDACYDANGPHYANCMCPGYYKPCDSQHNLQGIGEACSRNGENVYAACECKPAYKYVCEGFGPTNPNDFCLNGIKYYTGCDTCGNYGFMDNALPGIECSFENCSGKYYPTGKCAHGYTDVSDQSCEWYSQILETITAPERPN